MGGGSRDILRTDASECIGAFNPLPRGTCTYAFTGTGHADTLATFLRHYPNNSDPSEGFSSLGALISVIAGNTSLAHLGTQPIQQGEQLGDYLFSAWTGNGTITTEAPYVQYQTGQIGGAGDVVQMRFHFNTALKGTLDPILVYDPSAGVFSGKPDAAHADWAQSASASRYQTWINNLSGALQSAQLLDANFTGQTATVFTGTDGPRTGLPVAYSHKFQYNPTANAFLQGIQGIVANLIYPVSFGGSDGHNVLGNASVGTNVGVDLTPQVVVQQGSSDQNWTDFTASVTNVGVDIRETAITNINIVTTVNDLGAPGAPSNEPAAIDVDAPIFNVDGYIPAAVTTPALVTANTTLPAIFTTGMATLGHFLATLSSLAVPQALYDGMQALANMSELTRIANALEQIDSNTDSLSADLTAIALDFERLVNLLGSPPGDPDDDAHILNALTDLSTNLELLAETRQELTLRAKGVEVEAFTGSVFKDPP